MKYDEAKYELSQLGAKFLTKDEMKAMVKGGDLFIPYGCLHCGRAGGKSDFTDILYFEANDELFGWAQEHGGLTSSEVDYGMIARCKFCDHSDVFAEV